MVLKKNMTAVLTLLLVLCITTVSSWDNNAANASAVDYVHLVFMNHLDVGYNGLGAGERGLVNNVLNRYFQVYFPMAVKLAEAMPALGYVERLIYTTHPWLVSMYINCPPNLVLSGIKLQCPKQLDLQKFVMAVRRGDITWHAGPMNMQYEMMNKELIDFGLQISDDLDIEFQIQRQFKTLSQRDVPGMSRSLLPLFAKRGIEAITVGVNPMTAPPAVPKLFLWKHNNVSLISMWNPGGYPGVPGPDPAVPGGLSKENCVTFPGFNQALCFAFRSDNDGPPRTVQEILKDYDIVRGQFPNAIVRASCFENFVKALQPIRSKLPVVTKEIGDTWIQGPASDPRKIAEMRAFLRLRTKCIQKGDCRLTNPEFYNSSLFLTKLGEHTWGISSLNDHMNYNNTPFRQQLQKMNINYTVSVSSWTEQREFINMSLSTLGSNNPLVEEVQAEFDQIKARKPNLAGYKKVSISTIFKCSNGFKYQFGADGSLISLIDPKTGINWLSANNSIGQFVYQTYNQSDFDLFESQYSYNNYGVGIGKDNLTGNAEAKSRYWYTQVNNIYQAADGRCDFLVNTVMKNKDSIVNYGAPNDIWIQYTAVDNSLAVTIQWFDKQPTRLPEAIFFNFQPKPQSNKKWFLDKLGEWIDPLNVVLNGSQRHHAIDKGVAYVEDNMKGMYIGSSDSAIATVLTTADPLTTLPIPLTPLKDVVGVGFNLFNNVWDVNWIFWYPYLKEDKDQKFRFNVNFV